MNKVLYMIIVLFFIRYRVYSGGSEGGAEERSLRAPEFIGPNSSHVIQ